MPFELLAGFVAAVDYVHSIGWDAIVAWERELGTRFLEGLPGHVRLYGPATMEGRVPTFCFDVGGKTPQEAAELLGAQGIAVWHGNYYAVAVMERLGLPDGAVRAGIVHYNTADEVDRLLAALDDLA
jgi:selenocysteine lyase/cysteine desulfurase